MMRGPRRSITFIPGMKICSFTLLRRYFCACRGQEEGVSDVVYSAEQ